MSALTVVILVSVTAFGLSLSAFLMAASAMRAASIAAARSYQPEGKERS